MRGGIIVLTLLLAALDTHAQTVTNDKYFGPEKFKRISIGTCRVTEFTPYDFHFRCHSEEAFYEAHGVLLKTRLLEFNGFSRDFKDLPEYISFWVKVRKATVGTT